MKVLHFTMNPADIAATQRREELKSLQEENERLRQRVKLLEESEGKIEDLTVVVEKKLQEPGSSKDVEGTNYIYPYSIKTFRQQHIFLL